MDITRNQFFMAGLVLLFLGLQFRLVHSFVLTPEFTQVLAQGTSHPLASVNAATAAEASSEKPVAQKSVRPPEWIGWALISLGATLILHSLAMQKPG